MFLLADGGREEKVLIKALDANEGGWKAGGCFQLRKDGGRKRGSWHEEQDRRASLGLPMMHRSPARISWWRNKLISEQLNRWTICHHFTPPPPSSPPPSLSPPSPLTFFSSSTSSFSSSFPSLASPPFPPPPPHPSHAPLLFLLHLLALLLIPSSPPPLAPPPPRPPSD